MKNSIIEKIKVLKQKKNAIILAHNYQIGEVQDIADFAGDSLDLSKKAADTSADVILFCGVRFMAESAKILSPEKTVLLPDINAGCPLADMITVEKLKEKKKEHPDALVVCYVNTLVEIKAESDICCTSANVAKVVNSIPANKPIIFVPDKCLGSYASKMTKRDLILWDGYCSIHTSISAEEIRLLKDKHPQAKVLAHPECIKEVLDIADCVLSTNGMIDYVKQSSSSEFIIGTDTGIIHRLKKENPKKNFYPASSLAECKSMKLTNLEKVLFSLEEMKYEINIPEDIRLKAKEPIDKMLSL
ncbi:MAG: quinolinate synthase NadA [bacterium]|nr:quinolinate synthase NadA [bacterium]